MIYNVSFPIPVNTSKENPQRIEFRPLNGKLKGFSIMFPDGCLGLVGVRIIGTTGQILPFPAGWVAGRNRETIMVNEQKTLEGPPYVLFIEGYNLAFDYPHTIQIGLEVTR